MSYFGGNVHWLVVGYAFGGTGGLYGFGIVLR